jgi:pimeloyl-ACP methyl ester carboxylesterase
MNSGFAEVKGTRLYFESTAEGDPIVLLHGFALDRRMWQDQFGALSARYRVIRYDLRGFGRSAPPGDTQYSHAEDLLALLRYLDISEADIVGLSLGGGVALDFALTHPDKVRRLIVADSTLGGYQWSDAWKSTVAPIWSSGRKGDLTTAINLWCEHPLFESAMRKKPTRTRLKKMILGYSGWHWANRDPHRSLEPPALVRLNALLVPTLVVVGAFDLPDFQIVANVLNERIPGARKVVLPGVGHMSNMEAPETFNDLILGFLGSLQH